MCGADQPSDSRVRNVLRNRELWSSHPVEPSDSAESCHCPALVQVSAGLVGAERMRINTQRAEGSIFTIRALSPVGMRAKRDNVLIVLAAVRHPSRPFVRGVPRRGRAVRPLGARSAPFVGMIACIAASA